MATFSIKDFFTNARAKMFSFVINSDENVPAKVLVDSAGAEVMGLVTASPAANTIGDRLKQIFQALDTATVETGTLAAPSPDVLTTQRPRVPPPWRKIDLDEADQQVQATAGALIGASVSNKSTGWRWLKFYNALAANVTVGTTTPIWTVGISPGGAGVITPPGGPMSFSTALTVACTTGEADNDVGAPATNDVTVGVFVTG